MRPGNAVSGTSALVRWGLVAALVLGVAGCLPGGDAPPSDGSDVPVYPATAVGSAGMVVSGSSYATEAGVRMLEAGGTAVDAAVAAAFALAVAEPTQSGLGGRTQMLLHLADGTLRGIDGTTQVPAGYDPARAPEGEHGHGAVAIPGTVAALMRALDEHGTLPRSTVLAPALSFARDGIALPAGEARRLAGVADEVDPESEVARVFYGPGVTPLGAGERWVQPELAAVLEALARGGADAFYRGDIARRIADDMAANGGWVTVADLSDYQAVDSEVGQGMFAGHRVVGSYLPASGVTVIEILQILERVGPSRVDEGMWAAAVVEALRAGFEDRESAEVERAPGDATAWLTSDSLADRRAAGITARLSIPVAGGGDVSAGAATTLVAMPDSEGSFPDEDGESAFTTHISVADTFGNAVALTQSLGPTLGARVVTPGLGFLYASTLGGYLAGGEAGYRPWSSQAPLIVLRDDAPVLVLGGAGARRIVSALVSTLDRVLSEGEDLAVALAAPRLHPTGSRIDVQEGWGAAPALEALGYRVALREPSYFARLNVVEILAPRSFQGVGDPRWSESAAGGPRRE